MSSFSLRPLSNCTNKRALAVFISRAEFARVKYPFFLLAKSKLQVLTATAIFNVYSRSLL